MISRRVLCFLVCIADILVISQATAPEPATARPFRSGSISVDKDFRNALQQQTFMSVLTSIEERLRNLDSIYSAQLARSLDVKLDQYNRKLESLDTKIIRLEALVMLNLDKMSENISTKNFKDDIGRTDTFRKMDTMYEGISHRLSYMDRKQDGNFMKMQEKIDTALIRLERIEDITIRRDAGMEASFSEIMFTIDDFRTNNSETARKIEKVADAILNNTKDTVGLMSRYHTEERKSLSKFHDNIIANLEYIDNKTSEHYKVSDDTNGILKTMRSELKQDFNSYANKVADMNSDIWKTTDVTDEDLQKVAVVVNQTKIEMQNGIRSILVQIGKISSKATGALTDSEPYAELNKKLDDNFDKILTNQGIFMDSCHRLQMDESQMETEISKMFHGLIDMIEIKLSKETKNMKNFETFLKGHDTRVKRNVAQANNNIFALFQRSMTTNQAVAKDIRMIRSDLEGMVSLLHNALHDHRTKPEFEKIINQLNIMDNKIVNSMSNVTESLRVVLEAVSTTNDLTLLNYNMLTKIQNTDTIAPNATEGSNLKVSPKNDANLFTDEVSGKKSHRESNQKHKGQATETVVEASNESQDPIISTPGKIDERIRKVIEKVFGTPKQAVETTTIKVTPDVKEAIEAVFGTPPDAITPTPVRPIKCHLMDVRGNFGTNNCEESIARSTGRSTASRGKARRRKKKQKNISQIIDVRGNFDSQNVTDAEHDYDEEYSEEIVSTEATTETTEAITETTEATTLNQ